MNVLCSDRPKPLLPFAAGLRVIDFSLNNCVNSGIKNMNVLADYRREPMIDYLVRWARTNTRGINFRVSYPGRGSYCGTADAIYQNLDYLRAAGSENVLILAGDHIYKMDYRRMLAFHEISRADVTIGVVSVPHRDCSRFGIVKVDSCNRVTDFAEKPAVPKSNLASMGIYIFNTRALMQRLIEDSKNHDSLHDFGHNIIPGLMEGHRVFAFKFGGYWRDVGTAESYHEANMDILGQFSPVRMEKSWPILSVNGREIGLKNWNSGNISRSLFSAGCVMKGKVANSLLGPNVVVDSGAVVRNSIIMANTFIGRNSIVNNCIMDEEVFTGESCHIGTGDRLVILGKRRIIQSNSRIPCQPEMQEAERRISQESVPSLAMAY
jgi:glucose-1-phosphate adenylyltransferase